MGHQYRCVLCETLIYRDGQTAECRRCGISYRFTYAEDFPLVTLPADYPRLYYDLRTQWIQRGLFYFTSQRLTRRGLEYAISAMMQRAGTHNVNLHLVIPPILALTAEGLLEQFRAFNRDLACIWIDHGIIVAPPNMPWYLFESMEFLTADLLALRGMGLYSAGTAQV